MNMNIQVVPRTPIRSVCNGRDGAVLAVVLLMVLVLGILGMGVMKNGEYVGVEVSRDISRAKAFWTAEAGIEHLKTIAQKKRKPFGSSPAYDAYSSSLLGANVLSGTTLAGSYSVSVLNVPTAEWDNSMHGLKKYNITSRGVVTSGGVSYTNTITVRAIIQSFSSYMHATAWEEDRTGQNLWFTSGDVIDGPVYVNDQLNIQYAPRFLQLVSSSAGNPNYQNGANSTVFEGGFISNAAPISGQFTGDHITDIKNAAMANGTGGLVLTNDWTFVFRTNSFTYQQGTNTIMTNTTLLSNASGGAIYVSGNAIVRGVVNGKVTLAAQKSIFITNDIVYASALGANDPWSGSFSTNSVDDYIGLVASNSVIITMRTNVNIHAAIMVTSGASSGLEGFSAYWNASDLRGGTGNRPDIKLYGSLSQYRRGLIWNGTANGFDKVYKFDTRFYNDSPPNFPYSLYVFSAWSSASGN
ncbi:MAG: hypothetical protein WCS01_07000 [bacterium]